MKNIIDRFKEPSTYAGLMGVAMLVGLTTEQFQMYANAIAGVFGFIAIIFAEGTE